MQALTHWPQQARRNIVGVFTDIDDTLTTDGAITPDALQALADLKAAGLFVIPITGRPIGWCEPFMAGTDVTAWPVDAMVAENGGVAIVPQCAENLGQIGLQPAQNMREQLSKPYQKIYQLDASARADNTARMAQVAAQVLAEVPGVELTRDGGGRETDLAFDYAEHAQLTPAKVQQVLDVLHRAGMHTTVSSIHIHGCFGDFNKWMGACWIAQALLGRDLPAELDRWVFVGDSGNDQAMFQHFRHSVGVANIARFADQLTHLPTYVAQGARGAGFAQVARAILDAQA
jgi:HAD superfamily hydrolase (TIGR01484 family)